MLVPAFAIFNANLIALSAIISALTRPYDFHGKDNSIFGVVYIFCGIIGSLTTGIVLDKFRKFKLVLLIMAVSGILGYSGMFLSLPTKSTAAFATNLGILGLFSVPIVPLCFAFSVELTYP